jgi:hypothetical protein
MSDLRSLHFVTTKEQQTRHVHNAHGVRIAIMTTTYSLYPCEITEAEFHRMLDTHTQVKTTDGVSRYEIEIPGLDAESMSLTLDKLVTETAELLNDLGVSIVDWPQYCLKEFPVKPSHTDTGQGLPPMGTTSPASPTNGRSC